VPISAETSVKTNPSRDCESGDLNCKNALLSLPEIAPLIVSENVIASAVSVSLTRSFADGSREINDSKREAYRELARAGTMDSVSGFTGGPVYLSRRPPRWSFRRPEIAEVSGGDELLF
jgi:hypothetical protein